MRCGNPKVTRFWLIFRLSSIHTTKPDYKEKYQAYLASLSGSKKVADHLRDNNTIYVFVDKQREILNVGGFNYYGYTFGADNCAFIFNKHVIERKFGTFAHELAHSLGLEHTFELNDKDYKPNKSLDEKIKEKEGLLKKRGKSPEVQTTNVSTAKVHSTFKDCLEKLDWLSDGEKKPSYIAKLNKRVYYQEINTRILFIRNSDNLERLSKTSSEPQSMIDISQNLSQEIAELRKNRKENTNEYLDLNIAVTQENFMDYDYDSNNMPNSNFEPKSFWKWQWDSLKKSKFLSKKDI